MGIEVYLQHSKIIDWQHPEVWQQAQQLSAHKDSLTAIAQACFEWVRDEICHSYDYQLNPVTCSASEVLKFRTGYCYGKSHLLAALLRANSIPAGFCYQRLSIDDMGEPYSLHGLNGIFLPEIGWYRVDPRGNKEGIQAEFTPPQERLAYPIRLPGEWDCKQVFAKPLPVVVKALQTHQTWDELHKNLPDMYLDKLEILAHQYLVE